VLGAVPAEAAALARNGFANDTARAESHLSVWSGSKDQVRPARPDKDHRGCRRVGRMGGAEQRPQNQARRHPLGARPTAAIVHTKGADERTVASGFLGCQQGAVGSPNEILGGLRVRRDGGNPKAHGQSKRIGTIDGTERVRADELTNSLGCLEGLRALAGFAFAARGASSEHAQKPEAHQAGQASPATPGSWVAGTSNPD
jgi:hypothetical protein